MLTHLIQSKNVSMFLIDEPDIYLHSDLQRQLLGLLRNLGPDILIATHSTEIVTEAETDDIVLVNKRHRSAQRIRDPSQLREVFTVLGSNLNPVLTQLAKTRRVIFLEGKDFQILSKFAKKLGKADVALRRDFAVVPVEGFNPDRMRHLKSGMEETLGSKIIATAILDRDYRSDNQCHAIATSCDDFCSYVLIHKRKEIENFLLVPDAIDRALGKRIADRARRSGGSSSYKPFAKIILDSFCQSKKTYVASQYLSERRKFERTQAPQLHDASVSELALNEFEAKWGSPGAPFELVPGKEALSALNKYAQESDGVSVTPASIIDAMLLSEVPPETVKLIDLLAKFSKEPP
jgi:predicted ATP-dependent endonuclease of OLD family